MCIYIYMYIYICVCVCLYVFECVFACLCIRMCVCVLTHASNSIFTEVTGDWVGVHPALFQVVLPMLPLGVDLDNTGQGR